MERTDLERRVAKYREEPGTRLLAIRAADARAAVMAFRLIRRLDSIISRRVCFLCRARDPVNNGVHHPECLYPHISEFASQLAALSTEDGPDWEKELPDARPRGHVRDYMAPDGKTVERREVVVADMDAEEREKRQRLLEEDPEAV